MGLSNSPRIVTDGLVLCLDAANARSYPGTGATWYDLSPYGHTASIVGTSTWNSSYGGEFDFSSGQTTQYISLPYQAAALTGSYYTMEFWMRPRSVGTRYFCSMSSGSNHNYYILQNTSTIQRFGGTGSVSYSQDEAIQFCVVRDNSNTGKFYKNGKFSTNSTSITTISSTVSGGWILNQEQDSLGGNFDPDQNFIGAFMMIKLYNKALTPDEIRQNYLATKGRYE